MKDFYNGVIVGLILASILCFTLFNRYELRTGDGPTKMYNKITGSMWMLKHDDATKRVTWQPWPQ